MHNWVAQRPDFKSAVMLSISMVYNVISCKKNRKKHSKNQIRWFYYVISAPDPRCDQKTPKNWIPQFSNLWDALKSMKLWVWDCEYEIVSMKLWWQTTAGRAWHFAGRRQFRLLFTRPLLQKGSSIQEEILSVCLSVITVSFFEYSIIWCFTPCKPYIFWKLIMLATSTALFWSSTTEYQPVPPSTDPVFNDLMVQTM